MQLRFELFLDRSRPVVKETQNQAREAGVGNDT